MGVPTVPLSGSGTKPPSLLSGRLAVLAGFPRTVHLCHTTSCTSGWPSRWPAEVATWGSEVFKQSLIIEQMFIKHHLG